MTRGKPWSAEDEKLLRDYFDFTKDLRVIAFNFDGKYSENAIYQKLLDLGLISKEEETQREHPSSSTVLKLPEELPSVEEALKTLAATLKALEAPELEQSEVLRLRSIISGIKTYKELLADYIDYRGLEAELLKWSQKYAELAKKSQGTPS